MLGAVLLVWLAHWAIGWASAQAFVRIARGLEDAELLEAGGLYALEIVRLRQGELVAALRSGLLAFLVLRLLLVGTSYVLHRAAITYSGVSHAPARGPLGLASSAMAFLFTTLIGWAGTSLGLGIGVAYGRSMQSLSFSEKVWGLGILAVVLFGLGQGLMVLFDGVRIDLARGERWGAAFRRGFERLRRRPGSLWTLRLLLTAFGLLPATLTVWLARAVTHPASSVNLWAVFSLQCAALGAVLLQGAWLCHLASCHWAGTELEGAPALELSPSGLTAEASASAGPTGAPAWPGDPSPDPGA